MLIDFLMLGLEPGAADERIRARYLELVKSQPPESDAQAFQDIACAYDRIKDRRSRIHHQLFGCAEATDVESALACMARAVRPARQRAGLQDLLKAIETP